jgi:transcriptional regulator with XRE-family HTH domain
MNWNYAKLRGRIKEIFGTQEAFAKAIGISSVSLSQRLNNVLEFTQEEIFNSCEALNIPLTDMMSYFFTKIV